MPVALALRVCLLIVGAILLTSCQSSQLSAGASSHDGRHPARAITIVNDPGGAVLGYAWQTKKVQQLGATVRFAGRCDSACTLYLSVRESCILPGASFGFHAPYGSTARGDQTVKRYMMQSYPEWVRNWVYSTGGLGEDIKVMPYSYARNYLRPCDGRLRAI